MKFADVIEALQKGGTATRYRTPAFRGKKIVMQIPQTVPAEVVPRMTSLPEQIKAKIGTIGLDDEYKGTIAYHDQVLIVTLNDHERVSATSYVPTWEDIFAVDWSIAMPADESDMTNEDQAFAFANKNGGKYMNDEDPYQALRDGFLCGAQWKERQLESKSPWHKITEGDLPKTDIFVRARGRRPLPLDWVETLDRWTLAGTVYDQEAIARRWDLWMKIPNLPKD